MFNITIVAVLMLLGLLRGFSFFYGNKPEKSKEKSAVFLSI